MHRPLLALACLLPLAGCQFQSSLTTITNATIQGEGVNATRSWISDGRGEFDCVKSISGKCHYVLYTERCTARHATAAEVEDETLAADSRRCQAHVFTAFTLQAGTSRALRDLPPGLHQCVRHGSAPDVNACLPAKA